MNDDPRIKAPTSDVGVGNAVPSDAASRLASDGDAVPARESAAVADQGVPVTASAEGEQEPEAAAVDATEASLETERDLEAEADAVLAELTLKAEKADEYLGLAQRTKADFENYRKRSMREAALAQDRGIAKLAKELLPAMDNLDRALTAVETHSEDNHEQLVSGIKLVHADVISAFGRAGIEPFSPEGEPFDPQFHEAVAQQPFEGHAPGTVVEVYQRGYKLGETVLRPARVLVAA